MSFITELQDFFTDIATAIRSKTKSTDLLRPSEMAAAIESIEAVADIVWEDKHVSVTSANNQTVYPLAGKKLRSVTITPQVQEKAVNAPITDNLIVTPDSNKVGLSKVTISPPQTETKTIKPSLTAQTVTPTSGYLIKQCTVAPLKRFSVTATGTGANNITFSLSGYSKIFSPFFIANTTSNSSLVANDIIALYTTSLQEILTGSSPTHHTLRATSTTKYSTTTTDTVRIELTSSSIKISSSAYTFKANATYRFVAFYFS